MRHYAYPYEQTKLIENELSQNIFYCDIQFTLWWGFDGVAAGNVTCRRINIYPIISLVDFIIVVWNS